MTHSGIFILIAGANASGKSSVIKPKYIDGRIEHYLDPDRPELLIHDNLKNRHPESFVLGDIKEILTEKSLAIFKRVMSQPENDLLKGAFAIECMEDWLSSAIFRQEGIATESNLVTKHDRELFQTAKEHNMRTELYYVGLPVNTAKEREIQRVANGEQNKIDHVKLERRYHKALKINIHKHINSGNIDLVTFYDNSRAKGQDVEVMHIENGKGTLQNKPNDWDHG